MKSANNKLPLAIFLLAFLANSNTLFFNQYVLDDVERISKNKYVQQGISSFWEIVTNHSFSSFVKGELREDYRPLAILNFALEKTLFGTNPQVSHFFNVFFYALLCVVLFVFLRKLFARGAGRGTEVAETSPDPRYPSLILPIAIAALFTLHPIHTEVVANIKSRDEILCMLFGILSLNFIFDYHQKRKTVYLFLSCFAFFLCPFAKESGYAYVALIPLVLYFFTSASIKRIALLTSPFIVITAVHFLIRTSVLHTVVINKPIPVIFNSLMAATNPADQLATVFTILLHALKLLIFPVRLSWDYSYNQFPVVGWNNPVAIISLVIYLALAAVAIGGLKKKNLYSFVILFFFISYFITSNLVIKIAASFGERFLFAPSLAFCIALPLLLKIGEGRGRKNVVRSRISVVLLIMILLLFFLRTFTRNTIWKDNLSASESGIITAPNSVIVHQFYSNNLLDAAQATDNQVKKKDLANHALLELEKGTVMLYREHLLPFVSIPSAEKDSSRSDTSLAMQMYETSLLRNPGEPDGLFNYGLLILTNDNFSKAVLCFQKLLQLKSPLLSVESDSVYFSRVYYNLGVAYNGLEKKDEAISMYKKSLSLNPDYSRAWNDYGSVLFQLKDYASALECFKKSAKSSSDFSLAVINEGVCYFYLGDYKNAKTSFERALKLNPSNEEVSNYLKITNQKLEGGN